MDKVILNHLNLNSVDGAQLNMDALYRIAPSVFTEALDPKTGKTARKVDFEALRQLLGDNAVDGDGECYQFTWVGKNAAKAEAARSINKTLHPVPEDSVDWDNTKNIYIEGDNLEVLKLLQRSYLGKVKMIYIDPPYNTGNDFVYDDDFARTAAEEDLEAGNIDELGNRYRKNTDSNGKFHSDWCSMIYPRLMVARSLLTEDGVIFISIDDNEVRNLRNICDEVFGEANFVTQIIWQKIHSTKNDARYFSENHEYALVYAKNKENYKVELLPRTEEMNQRYKNPDNDPRGPWQSGDLVASGERSNGHYLITSPKSGKTFDVPQGKHWVYSEKNLQQLVLDNQIWFGEDGNSFPRKKRFLSDVQDGRTASTIWLSEEVGHNQTATREVKQLFDDNKYFDFPKPVTYIKQMLKISTTLNDVILDFFSGSATTAHAVMQLNAEDEGNRKFIMVQLPEETAEDSEAFKAGYKNIPEIGKERIRRAGKKIKEESPLTTQNLDTGFRVFRLDESNYEEVSISPKDYDQNQLDLFANNIKADRTDLDLLFGAMLAWGVQLDMPMNKEVVDGCTIYTVNNGDLVACFSEGITDKVVTAMASKMPLRVLFRDSCFTQDAQKINIYEQFKQAMDWTDDEAFKNIKVI
ncbi:MULTISPECIES: site-specific DNA-methyltransferase [Bacteroidaceae]|jgi:putative modification enzyme of type III restriction-modification system|uniref:site-specific DNA-methyltransferase n=1 Tax=Bacteroidaceae TaxID=815 RepID=UPI001584A057|nr:MULTISPECIES: site-specific DNA-methyltransferase [Bacteroidaceae]MDQ6238842.1 site-specific DNA-methyltransferase [Bacteroides ovatus]NUK99513.1 site-specific DNA-methyltransferase [Phocaeicola sartorii]